VRTAKRMLASRAQPFIDTHRLIPDDLVQLSGGLFPKLSADVAQRNQGEGVIGKVRTKRRAKRSGGPADCDGM
jgi:hypothetical protein